VDGFEVEPTALRAAAGQIQATGGQLTGAAQGVPAAAQPATAANPGYALAAAVADFAEQLATSIRTAGQAVTEHGDNLGATADAYDRGEESNAGLFEQR
jgi:hypothetical protein